MTSTEQTTNTELAGGKEAEEKKPERYSEQQKEALYEYRQSQYYKDLQNQAKIDIEKRKSIERFQQYSKLEAQRHLKDYVNGKFWGAMSNALLSHDVILKRDNIKLILCDDFYEGVYMPDKNKILLCANTLMLKKDFDNAMARHLIFMYDYNRSKANEGTYDLAKCKHLACSEVRAALFTDHCKIQHRVGEMFRKSNQHEKIDAQAYCFKQVASAHLKEKDSCSAKAEKYVDFVFDQCINDKSPFSKGSGRSGNVKNFTDIL